MAVIAACGVLLAWGRAYGPLAAHSIIAWALSFVATFALARKFGPSIRGRGARTVISSCLTIALAAAIYLAWAHWRADSFIMGLDHALPYPDPWINALERWFDARRPVRPHILKLHGEYPIVAFILGMLVIIPLGAAGWLAGLLSNRPDDRRSQGAGTADV